ncbi:MAG: zinc ABC transporter substrate-binding protein, partial [Anaerolineales bacterium]
MRGRKLLPMLLAVFALLAFAASCSYESPPANGNGTDEMPALWPIALAEGEKLQVIATTSIVADVVANVAGDSIELTTLLPPGIDPHGFEPAPQDVAAVADAHVVFASGAGLETFLDDLIESVGEGIAVVPVSHGIELLDVESEHGPEDESEHEHNEEGDAHTWLDPHNVITWVENIEHALSAVDPANAETYQARAAAYVAELQELDAWIEEQVAQVPEANRKLVTDHTALSYFARHYGLDLIGAVFPGYSTLAEPSARELAELEDAIIDLCARADAALT